MGARSQVPPRCVQLCPRYCSCKGSNCMSVCQTVCAQQLQVGTCVLLGVCEDPFALCRSSAFVSFIYLVLHGHLCNLLISSLLLGSDHPVLLGNHRDAWVFGGMDPNSGTASMLEIGQAIGSLRQLGKDANCWLTTKQPAGVLVLHAPTTLLAVFHVRVASRSHHDTLQLGCRRVQFAWLSGVC